MRPLGFEGASIFDDRGATVEPPPSSTTAPEKKQRMAWCPWAERRGRIRRRSPRDRPRGGGGGARRREPRIHTRGRRGHREGSEHARTPDLDAPPHKHCQPGRSPSLTRHCQVPKNSSPSPSTAPSQEASPRSKANKQIESA